MASVSSLTLPPASEAVARKLQAWAVAEVNVANETISYTASRTAEVVQLHSHAGSEAPTSAITVWLATEYAIFGIFRGQ
eukprot:2207022-Pleurochrysis_carterae.AAC.4